MLTDFLKWGGLVLFSMILIVLSALSYVHMVIPMVFTLLIFVIVYIKSLLNEYPFLNFDISHIDLNLDENMHMSNNSSIENARLL